MAEGNTNRVLRICLNLVINVAIIVLLYQLFLLSYGFAYQVFANDSYDYRNETPVSITIDAGSSLSNVGAYLEERNVIENKYSFVLRARISKYKGKLTPGTYEVSAAMPTDTILSILSGEVQEDKEE